MFLACVIYIVNLALAMWTLRNAISDRDGQFSDIYWSQIRRWFLIEQNLFCGQITAGSIFLMVAYTQRLKSFWNQNKPRFRVLGPKQVVVDIWRDRSHSDLLHYLKFEFVQYAFFGSYLFTGLLMMPFSNKFMKMPAYIEETN